MTRRVLLAEFKQETSSFNPVATGYERFQVCAGRDFGPLLGATNTEIAGALEVFARPDIEVAPALAAWSGSGGPVRQSDLDRLLADIDGAVADAVAGGCDGVYMVFHGAMAGQVELDPEGAVLEALRTRVGADVPIVLSMDLHGVLTDRMVAGSQGIVPFHTYPHVDFHSTGKRAAGLLLRLLAGDGRPCAATSCSPPPASSDRSSTAAAASKPIRGGWPPAS
jgi:microcystin degradation protein MlrC